MKILLIVDCYLPATKSAALMMHELGLEFKRLGHDVIIVAPDDSLTVPKCTSKRNDLTVLRVRTGKIKSACKFNRAVNEILLSSTIWKAGKSFFQANRCDLVVFYSPSIFLASLVKKLKKLWKCKTYMILRDIFPQWALDTGILKKGLIYNYFRFKELQQYEVADIVGIESSGNKAYFTKNGLDNKIKLEVLHNWTTLDKKNSPESNYRQRLRLNDKVVFFYGGNIGIVQRMDNIIALAESLHNHRNIHFLLVGDGSEVPRLKKIIKEKELCNITIHPPVSQDKYLDMLRQFDVGLITLDQNLKSHNYPSKMLGYMYYSMPILAGINRENTLKRLLEDSQAGFACLSIEHKKFRNYALKLADNHALRQKMGRNARILLEEKFSVNKAVTQILSHTKALI